MVKPLLVLTTLGTRADADALARTLVERGLAACAQISEISSVYRWQGQLHHEPEWRVVFKTVPERYPQIEAAIRERHPYELPAILAIATTEAFEPFARWVAENSGADPEGPAGGV